MADNFKRTLVTCALPYANGPIHIGHLAGVYVPADIYVRYLRLRGKEVLYVCGSDEHGVPITIKARQLGCSPQDIVDKYHNIIKDSFKALGINFDVYGRTSSKIHAQTASEFFKRLYDSGKFITRESEQYYDPEAKTFLADRYIPAPSAVLREPMATSARNAVPPFRLKNSSIPSPSSAVPSPSRRRPPTGTFPLTATSSGSASGYWKDTRSGAPMYTVR